MEQFFIVIAVLVFWVFKQASSGQRRRFPGEDAHESGPLTKSGLDASLEEANRRAMEALRRWEEKQGLGKADPETFSSSPRRSPTRREPLPRATRERTPRVTLARRSVERERKKAYADIAQMLDPKDTPRFRLGAHAETDQRTPKPARAAAEAQAQAPAAAPQRPADSDAYRQTTPGERTRGKTGPEAALASLERLPLAARAIVYAEILGRPRYLD